jgi:aspartate/methionine/tyrosine aminotransferase/prephenate dehydrogenase
MGFGNFGQFLAKTFVEKEADVFAASRTDYSLRAAELGVVYHPMFDLASLFAHGLDVLVLSVSINSFESVLGSIPSAMLKDVLVVDVCSVKMHPRQLMLALLPEESGILCTHPMFGPESGKFSWKDLPLLFDCVRLSNATKQSCTDFLGIFQAAGCRMVELSCEIHDRYAAGSQFVTHLTGRVLGKLGIRPTPIDTTGFKSLLGVVDTTEKDSFDLFYGLFKHNRHSIEQLNCFQVAFEEIRRLLFAKEQEKGGTSGESTALAFPISPVLLSLEQSKTAEMHAKTKLLQGRGIEILSLCVGEPDLPVPAAVLQAAIKALQSGCNQYTTVNGAFAVRSAIAEYYHTTKAVPYKAADIVVSNGGKQAIYQAVMTICRSGDEVVIPSPHWVSYPQIVKLSGATPVFLATTAAAGYLPTVEQLASAITSSTRIIIICNPCNPTGAMWPPALLEGIAALLMRPEYRHVFVLADEIYERTFYDVDHVAFASLPGMFARTLTINGFSKGYSMMGFRLGYLAAPAPIAEQAAKLQSQLTSCAGSISQEAAVAALATSAEDMAARNATMRERRDFVVQQLRTIPGITCPTPQGAFYAFPDVSDYFSAEPDHPDHDVDRPASAVCDAEGFCLYLLDWFQVALVPGSAFGCPEAVRISYAAPMEVLRQAMGKFRECCLSLASARSR